jgi:hypothetical protein
MTVGDLTVELLDLVLDGKKDYEIKIHTANIDSPSEEPNLEVLDVEKEVWL